MLVMTQMGRDLRCRRDRVDRPTECRACGCAIPPNEEHIRQGVAASRDDQRRYCPSCAIERGIALIWIR